MIPTHQELAARGLLPTSDPWMAYRPYPRRAVKRPSRLAALRARFRAALVSCCVVADPGEDGAR